MNINGMEWKKVNIAPVYKIDNRQFINNCQPVLLFPICAKVLEKIILKYLFKYIDTNNLLNNNQCNFYSSFTFNNVCL